MNCFEARKEFVAYWRRTMPPAERSSLVAHLGGCARCERAFRVFALSAPALHSAAEPGARRISRPVIPPRAVKTRGPIAQVLSMRPARVYRRALLSGGVAAAMAAIIAIYITIPSRPAFEDAIADETPSLEIATYKPAEDIFEQGFFGQDAMVQDSLLSDQPAEARSDLAG